MARALQWQAGPTRSARGPLIANLLVGEPDFDAPIFIRQAAAETMCGVGASHWTTLAGRPEFRHR
jgi:aspartate aminotransferase